MSDVYSCELPCRCWELHLGPLEKQPVFLTISHLSSPGLSFLNAEIRDAYQHTPFMFRFSFIFFSLVYVNIFCVWQGPKEDRELDPVLVRFLLL